MLPGDTLTLISGDDYSTADGRAPEWTAALTPADLTGATVRFYVRGRSTDVLLETGAGSVVVPVGTNQIVQVAFSAAQTAALLVSDGHLYSIEAVLTNGRRITLAMGRLIVERAP